MNERVFVQTLGWGFLALGGVSGVAYLLLVVAGKVMNISGRNIAGRDSELRKTLGGLFVLCIPIGLWITLTARS